MIKIYIFNDMLKVVSCGFHLHLRKPYNKASRDEQFNRCRPNTYTEHMIRFRSDPSSPLYLLNNGFSLNMLRCFEKSVSYLLGFFLLYFYEIKNKT